MDDIYFLKRTLKLARKGMGWVSPNPMVGAIFVKSGQIIGKGYHKKAGLPHGEIEALHDCKEDPKGAKLYVNLEPCSYFGKTPPCIDAIIQSGIKQVVCCSLDPNPKVAGKGIEKLEESGIDVSVGGLKEEAQVLNEAFFTFHEKKRPFIVLKFAASLDGKIATRTGDSKWITCDEARQFARSLRGEYQAVLVGINTVIRDDPHLGVRDQRKKDPVRIIMGSGSKIPPGSQVLRDKHVIIARGSIKKLLSDLVQKQIISVLVEGGGSVLGSFFDEGVVDKVYAFYSPVVIGGEKAVSAVGGSGVATIPQALRLKNTSCKRFDDNFLITGYVAS